MIMVYGKIFFIYSVVWYLQYLKESRLDPNPSVLI